MKYKVRNTDRSPTKAAPQPTSTWHSDVTIRTGFLPSLKQKLVETVYNSNIKTIVLIFTCLYSGYLSDNSPNSKAPTNLPAKNMVSARFLFQESSHTKSH